MHAHEFLSEDNFFFLTKGFINSAMITNKTVRRNKTHHFHTIIMLKLD